MKLLLLLPALLLLASAAPSRKSPTLLRTVARNAKFTPMLQPARLLPVPLIFGGTVANQDLARRTARLSVCFGSECGFSCTASILNLRLLLTAAHCVYNGDAFASAVTVFTGGNSYVVRLLHVHKGYIAAAANAEEDVKADIAVLRLKKRLPGPVKQIQFKLTTRRKQLPREFEPVRVAGHGLTSAGGQTSPNLMVGDATLLPNAQCNGYDARGFVCTDTQRASGVLCRGDSGGPMFVKLKNGFRLVGVNSAVLLETIPGVETQPFTCGDNNTVHIYSSVLRYFRAVRSCFKGCSKVWRKVVL